MKLFNKSTTSTTSPPLYPEVLGSGLEKSPFPAIDHLADRGVVNSENLGNLFQGVAVAAVGQADQAVSLLLRSHNRRRKKLLKKRPADKPLHSRDLRDVLFSTKKLPYPVDEPLAPEENLSGKFFPRRFTQRHSLFHKMPVPSTGFRPAGRKVPENPGRRQKQRNRCRSQRWEIAAPAPLLRTLHHFCPHGVQHEVATQLKKVTSPSPPGCS